MKTKCVECGSPDASTEEGQRQCEKYSIDDNMQEQETIRKDISDKTLAELEREFNSYSKQLDSFRPLHIERIGDKVFLVG